VTMSASAGSTLPALCRDMCGEVCANHAPDCAIEGEY